MEEEEIKHMRGWWKGRGGITALAS
jgi:hypothetical protein